MYSVHFGGPLYIVRFKQEKIAVHAAPEHFTAGDLCFMALAWPELCLAFQVDVPGSKEPLVDIVIDRADGHVQFRVVCHDLVRGLPLIDQMGYQFVFLRQLGFCHVYAVSGSAESLFVFTVGETCIVHILVCNSAFMDCLVAAIADIRGLVQPSAAFSDKIAACLVAGRAGSAFDPAEDDLATDIRLPAMVSVDAEVVGVVESTLVIPVAEAVLFDLFRNGRGVFAQKTCDVLKGRSFGKRLFNVETIPQGEVFLVSRYKIAHVSSFYCCQKAGESYHERR